MMAPKTAVTLITVHPFNTARHPEVLGVAEGHDKAHALDVALSLASGKNASAYMSKTDEAVCIHYDGRLYGRIFLKRLSTYEVS